MVAALRLVDGRGSRQDEPGCDSQTGAEQLPVARLQPAPRYHSGHIVATRRAEEEGSWTDRALGDDDAGQQRRSGPRSRPTVDRAKHQRYPCTAAGAADTRPRPATTTHTRPERTNA